MIEDIVYDRHWSMEHDGSAATMVIRTEEGMKFLPTDLARLITLDHARVIVSPSGGMGLFGEDI